MYPRNKLVKRNMIMPITLLCLSLSACGGDSSSSSVGEVGAKNSNPSNSTKTLNKRVTFNYPPEELYSVGKSDIPPSPRYLQSADDSSYATKITRVTEKAVHSQFGDHPYSVQGTPWNYDSTMYNLGNRLYVSSTNKESVITSKGSRDDAWYKLGEPAGGGASLYWSHIDPNVMYSSTEDGRLIKITMNAQRTDVTTDTILDLTSEGFDTMKFGNNKGQISNDGKYVVIVGRKNQKVYAILYNLLSEKMVFKKRVKEGDWADDQSEFGNIGVDPTGTFLVAKISGRIHVYDINLKHLYVMPGSNPEGGPDDFIGHNNMGIDVNGDPVLVAMTHHKHTISMFNLKTRKRHELLDNNYGGGHIATGNYRRPGWAYISTEGPEGRNGESRDAFAIKLDPAASVATVQYFAHTHNTNPNNDYRFQTHIGVNPVGDVVLFRSKWGGSTGDTYLAKAK